VRLAKLAEQAERYDCEGSPLFSFVPCLSVVIPGPLHFGGSIVRSLVEFGGRNRVFSPSILHVWISLCSLVACVNSNLLAIAVLFVSPVLEWKALNVYSLTSQILHYDVPG